MRSKFIHHYRKTKEYYSWCQPCKELTPLLEKVVKDSAGAIKLAKLNVDENPEMTEQLQVRELPTV
jgi:putative thioredoxin